MAKTLGKKPLHCNLRIEHYKGMWGHFYDNHDGKHPVFVPCNKNHRTEFRHFAEAIRREMRRKVA